MKKVYLVCGTGASSGFMAAAIRKTAKKQGLELTAVASSETQLMDNINDVSVVLVGPHIAYKEKPIRDAVEGKDIKVGIIPQDVYGSLDGNRAIEYINSL